MSQSLVERLRSIEVNDSFTLSVCEEAADEIKRLQREHDYQKAERGRLEGYADKLEDERERLQRELVEARAAVLDQHRHDVKQMEFIEGQRDRLRAALQALVDDFECPADERGNIFDLFNAARDALHGRGPAVETSVDRSKCQHEWTDVARCLVCGLTYDLYESEYKPCVWCKEPRRQHAQDCPVMAAVETSE